MAVTPLPGALGGHQEMTFSRSVCPKNMSTHVPQKYLYHPLDAEDGFIYNILFAYTSLSIRYCKVFSKNHTLKKGRSKEMTKMPEGTILLRSRGISLETYALKSWVSSFSSSDHVQLEAQLDGMSCCTPTVNVG